MSEISFPTFNTEHDWASLSTDAEAIRLLETVLLPPYVNTCRWFAGKARAQEGFSVKMVHKVPIADTVAYLLIVEARYTDGGDAENYLLPLSFLYAEGTAPDINPKGILTIAYVNQKRGLLIDALYDERFQQALFRGIATNLSVGQAVGRLHFQRGKGLDPEDIRGPISSRVLGVDSSNSALIFGDKYFLKLYRKLFRQTNPEVELVSFLTEHSDFAYIPAFAGSLTWQREGTPDVTLGMMQRLVENQQDTWGVTGQHVGDFLQGFLGRQFCVNETVFEEVELLGRRTAEMHLGLYAPQTGQSEVSDPMFRAEAFTDEYRAFLLGRINRLLDSRYALLIDKYLDLDPQAQRLAWVFMEAKELLDEFLEEFQQRPFHSLRTRVHGDYHLGQVLATQNDFIIIDFEGEPESSIAERKIKHSPLKDVAGMIRSYHYAVSAGLFNAPEAQQTDPVRIDPERLLLAADRWYRLMRDTFLETYLATFGPEHPLFKNNTEINFLLLVYLLEKAVYELGYELSYRPTWVKIPLKGIVDVIREVEKLRGA
ncbi:MAG: putative maltokinase [Cytophagaceae bacterium]|nr:putative maltokinase [Cytophagaceae bacterium]